MLDPFDQIDLGVVKVFLGEDAGLSGDTLLALSPTAAHLAVARGSHILLLPQGSAAARAPQHIICGDTKADGRSADGDVLSMLWVQLPVGPPSPSSPLSSSSAAAASTAASGTRDVLFVGAASGRLSAFAINGGNNAGGHFACEFSSKLHGAGLIELQQVDQGRTIFCLHRGGVLVRVSDLPRVLGGGGGASSPSPREMASLVWKCSLDDEGTAQEGECHAFACCGAVPHVPLDLEHDGAPSRKLALVAVQPSAISLHHLRPPSTDHASSSSSSWGLVSRRSREHAGESTSRLMRTFADHPRGFLSVALEPLRKHWLAATDSLGRVSVFEAKALVCVRLFKGYRDAQIGWTDAASAGCCTETLGGTAETAAAARCSVRADDALLVIYAPRRGLLEVWRAPTAERVAACNVGFDCLLLPAPPASASVSGTAADEKVGTAGTASADRGMSTTRLQMRCFIVKADGVIHLVRRPAAHRPPPGIPESGTSATVEQIPQAAAEHQMEAQARKETHGQQVQLVIAPGRNGDRDAVALRISIMLV